MLQNFHITSKLEGGYLMFWLVLVQKKIKVHISLTHDQLDCIKILALLSQDSVPLDKLIVSLNLIFFT